MVKAMTLQNQKHSEYKVIYIRTEGSSLQTLFQSFPHAPKIIWCPNMDVLSL